MITLAEVFEIDPVRFTQLPFVDVLEHLLDVPRVIRVETRIFDEPQAGLEPNLVPLKKS